MSSNHTPVKTAPGVERPWMKALEVHEEVHKKLQDLVTMTVGFAQKAANVPPWRRHKGATRTAIELLAGWSIDLSIVGQATPYSFSKETIEAIRAASSSVPEDTQLNSWNLETDAVFWYLDEPLPYVTLAEYGSSSYIRVISMGWQSHEDVKMFFISLWSDVPANNPDHFPGTVTASQTWTWQDGETLDEMMNRVRSAYNQAYGPGGQFADEPKIGVDAYMIATEAVSRFILAALCWIQQTVVVTIEGQVDRASRRRAERRAGGRPHPGVRVVQLRRAAYAGSSAAAADPAGDKRQYNCQWQVDGHWRNQPVGAGRKERKLIYIMPYMKGPEDKPFRTPAHKIYRVER